MRDMQTPAGKLGRRICRLRESPGRWMEQKDLAALIGMSQSNLSRIERGTVTLSVDALCKIAQALGTTASQMLMDVGA